MPGFQLKSPKTAIIVAVVYSLINFFLGWILKAMAFPFMILTLGLFTLVINTFLLWITDKVLDDFKIDSIKTTFIAAVIITVVGSISRAIF